MVFFAVWFQIVKVFVFEMRQSLLQFPNNRTMISIIS